MHLLKLTKYIKLASSNKDHIYVAADKIYTLEEIYSLNPTKGKLEFSHTAVDVGFEEHIIKVEETAEQICKMLKPSKK